MTSTAPPSERRTTPVYRYQSIVVRALIELVLGALLVLPLALLRRMRSRKRWPDEHVSGQTVRVTTTAQSRPNAQRDPRKQPRC